VTSEGEVLDPGGFDVSAGTWSQLHPAVESDGEGWVVAWSDGREGPTNIFAARVTSKGVVQDPEGIKVSTHDRPEQEVAVAWNGGLYLLAWTLFPSGQGSVVVDARVTPEGSVLDSPPLKLSGDGGFQGSPTVASDGEDFLVAWNGELSSVMASRVTADGEVLDGEGIVVAEDQSGEEREALASAIIPESALGAIRKIVAGAIGEVLLTCFGFIDGTADPPPYPHYWPPFRLVPADDPEWLQDEFLDSYWEWKKRRRDPGWSLDIAPGEPT
jgi:hypothetical protein